MEKLVRENGLDTPIGNEFGGIELSGGDNQRLGLARTMFRDSSMVVLDEPTSAMDPTFESEVLEKFLEISENKTSLVISHRLGLCRVVDRIIVMNNGEIVGIGTHKELFENNAEYIKTLYGSRTVVSLVHPRRSGNLALKFNYSSSINYDSVITALHAILLLIHNGLQKLVEKAHSFRGGMNRLCLRDILMLSKLTILQKYQNYLIIN
ncbi:ATP-binding cassette domain-containing protein [Paenibacillus rhizoplanae]